MAEPPSSSSKETKTPRKGITPTREQVDEMAHHLIGRALGDEGVGRALERNGIPGDGVFEGVLAKVQASRTLQATVARVAAAEIATRESGSKLWDAGLLSWSLGRLARWALIVLAVWVGAGGLVAVIVGRGVASGALLAGGTGLFAIAALSTQLPRLRRLQAAARFEWEQAEQEYGRLHDDAIEHVLLPEVRARIYQLVEPDFSSRLEPVDAGGLRNLFDPRYEVPLGATTALRDTLAGLEEAGSVGIAGPRGVGKTTLIKAACEGRLDFEDEEEGAGPVPSGVMVSAPVRYKAQDFVRFLFAKLCLTELAGSPEEERFERARAANQRRLAALLAVMVGIVVPAVAALLVIAEVPLEPAAWLAIGSIPIGLAAMFGYLRLLSWQRARHRLLFEDPVTAEAKECYDQLSYLETRSEELSGEIAAKAMKIGAKRGVSRAAQVWTLPEMIERYRRFLDMLTYRGPVVIGIDELDKMAGAEEARSFLNEMKSLFEQPNVYYLVSVSEDALSDFERRGQPIRDVFDSVFNDILHVGYLSREESDLLLRRRAIGVAPPWPALFHCLAGGLPRESIRVARRAVQIAETQAPDLTAVTLQLVAERVAAHEHAASVVGQGKVNRDGTQPVLTWLRDLPPIGPTSNDYNQPPKEATEAALLKRIEGAADAAAQVRSGEQAGLSGETGGGLERLVMELAAGWHHALTCFAFFAGLEEKKFDEACEPGAAGLNAIELLARGHQDLSSSPALAWQTVTAFRERVGLKPLPYPVAAPSQGTEPPPLEGSVSTAVI